ncbi:hypothetical protein [Chryseobacterium indoltheticum]|uniref:hypothetical protein n=1 Tax=Chryseobacterium indoltheticum TaxID=254 RepID=UPI003F493238
MYKVTIKRFFGKLGHLARKSTSLGHKSFGIIATICIDLGCRWFDFDHNIDYLHHALPTWSEMLKQVLFGLAGGLIARF